MPEKGTTTTIKFQNYHKQLQAPFAIYADFEVITEKVSGCTPNKKMVIRIQKLIRITKTAHMRIKYSAAKMMSTLNQRNYIRVKIQSTIFFFIKCLMK